MTARPLALAVAVLVAAAAGCGAQEDAPAPVLDPGDPSGTGPIATELLQAHNDVRAGAQPAPSPALAALQWSSSAATTAQAWVDGCQYGHDPGRGQLGENIAAVTAGYLSPSGIVALWAAEAPFYDLAANTCDTSAANDAGTCGHYTQLVWRDTLRVGCGYRTCTTGSPFGDGGNWEFYVCDYEPAGNVAGQRPY